MPTIAFGGIDHLALIKDTWTKYLQTRERG